MTAVFMFPGQSSRRPDMIERMVEFDPTTCRPILEVASRVVGFDVEAHYRAANAAMFERNVYVQIGVFLANHLHLRVLQARGIEAPLSLGLSLGEYNHLVHIEALSFEDALALIVIRGQTYDTGPRGMMASVFPIELDELQTYVERASSAGIVEVANLNSPSQFVLSGQRVAVERAMGIIEQESFAECRVIEEHVPMHSSAFLPAAMAFRPALEAAPWARPDRHYLPNVLGNFASCSSPATFVELLTRHVSQPVRWRESIDRVAEHCPDAVFVEVGPRAVLYNLLRRDWRSNPRCTTDHPDDLRVSFARVEELLGAA